MISLLKTIYLSLLDLKSPRYYVCPGWLDYRARWEYIKRWRVHHLHGFFLFSIINKT